MKTTQMQVRKSKKVNVVRGVFSLLLLSSPILLEARGRTSSLNEPVQLDPEDLPPPIQERDSHVSGCQYLGKFYRDDPESDHYGKEISDLGKTEYVGGFYQCDYHGEGRKSYADGSFYDGEWRFGKPHGVGKYRYSNGDYYEGQWDDGQFHGQGKFQYLDRGQYIGEYVRGRREGQGVYKLRDGFMFEGEWKDDKPHGKGKMTDHKGKITVGDFQSKPQGKQTH